MKRQREHAIGSDYHQDDYTHVVRHRENVKVCFLECFTCWIKSGISIFIACTLLCQCAFVWVRKATWTSIAVLFTHAHWNKLKCLL